MRCPQASLAVLWIGMSSFIHTKQSALNRVNTWHSLPLAGATNLWTSRCSLWSLCSLCSLWAEELVRWRAGLNRLDKIPPVLRRAASLTDWVLVSGVGGAGDLTVPVRRIDSLGAAGAEAFGSRTEAFLFDISPAMGGCKWGDF